MASIENQARQWLEIMQRNQPKPQARQATTSDGPQHDDLGRAVHYDLEKHPPGSVINSNVIVTPRSRHDEARHGEIPMASPGKCCICEDEPFEFHLKSEWRQHNDALHNGKGLWESTTGVSITPRSHNSHIKPTKSESIDPYGRTIVGTPSQLKGEAQRHGVTIVDGPGS